MSEFFATEEDTRQARADAELAPRRRVGFFDDPQGEGGWFEGLGKDIQLGVARGGYGFNAFLGGFARASRELNNLGDEPNWFENYFAQNRDSFAEEMRRHRIDPATRSAAANNIGGLASMFTTAATTTAVGGPAGMLSGPLSTGLGYEQETYEQMIAQGVDEATARGAAQREGALMGAMTIAPISLPGRLLTRVGTGAILGVGFGGANRYTMNAYLTEQGYPELAAQYQWMDGQQAAIDAIFGAAFGGVFGHRAPEGTRPHPPQEGEAQLEGDGPPPLPIDAEGYFDEARQYGNDEQFPEAYAYALVARDLGHAEAEDLVRTIEEDASPDELDAGRALAEEISQRELANQVRNSDLPAAAMVEADSIQRQTAFGVPVDQASARWQREALDRMEEQAARDEPLDPGPRPEGVDYVELPENPDALSVLEQEMRARGIDPDEVLYSRRDPRGVGKHRGTEAFHDDRLTEAQNKAVEMARNNYSNAEIAEEMETSPESVAVHLSRARRITGIEIDAGQKGTIGFDNRLGRQTATIEEIIRLRNFLRKQPRFRTGSKGGGLLPGQLSINRAISERLGVTLTSVGKRISDYERQVREGKREPITEATPLHSVSDGEGGTSVEALNAEARRVYGVDADTLAQASKSKLVSTASELPFPVPENVAAVHYRGQSSFIADRMSVADMAGKMLHEIGIHEGFQSFLGKRGYNEVNRQISQMVAEGHPAARDALRRALQEDGIDKLNLETGAYLVERAQRERVLANLIEDAPETPLVQRLLSQLRQWLIKTFGTTFGMRLTVDDIRQLAVSSLRRVAENARRKGGEGPVEIGQFADSVLNSANGKRDPIESPDYQGRIAELRARAKERAAGEAEAGRPGGATGVSGEPAGSKRAGRGAAGLQRSQGPTREELGAVIGVSGIRITKSPVRQGGLGFGALRAEIDTPTPTDADAVLQAPQGAQGGRTGIDFDLIDGSNPKETRLPGVYLRLTRVNDAGKGKGVGQWLYRQVVDWADRQGLPVYSDFSVSAEAQSVYGALERRGYRVEQINPAARDTDGSLNNTHFQPIFRISRTGIEEPYDAAPLPRNDYEIDGPTLRERQAEIDAQRKAEEAFAKLPPAEQAMADDPEMNFSVKDDGSNDGPDAGRLSGETFDHGDWGRRLAFPRGTDVPPTGAVEISPAAFERRNDIVTGADYGEQAHKVLSVGGEPVAVAELWRGPDGITIQRIDTVEGARRRGYATQLIDDIFAEFPGTPVRTTLQTKKGSALFAQYERQADGTYLPRRAPDGGRLSDEVFTPEGENPARNGPNAGGGGDEPLFSRMTGRERQMRARELMERVAQQKQQAAEMRKGFEAAAACAVRHGIRAAATPASFVTLRATAAGALPSANAGLGQVLGLAASIPLGVTATPILARAARRASPMDSPLWRQQDETMRAHFSEAGRLGELAGGLNDDYTEHPVMESATRSGGVEQTYDPPQESEGFTPGVHPEGFKVPPAPPSAGKDRPSTSGQDLINLFRPIVEGENE